MTLFAKENKIFLRNKVFKARYMIQCKTVIRELVCDLLASC